MKWLYLLTLVFTQPLWSESAAKMEVSDTPSIQQYLNDLKSYEANFQQQRYSVNRQLLDTTSGRFVLKRPNQFIWQTYSPFEQVISSDGTSVWTKDIDLEQVIISPVDLEIENAPIFLLTDHQESIDEVFNIEYQGIDENDFFVLTPKDESGAFERLRIGFEQGTFSSLELYDSLGQLTRISMTNIRKNPILDIGLFKPEIPVEYDIIDNRPATETTP